MAYKWIANYKLCLELPEIVGVSTPSPIIMQVPNKTTINSQVRDLGYFSKNNLILELCQVSGAVLSP